MFIGAAFDACWVKEVDQFGSDLLQPVDAVWRTFRGGEVSILGSELTV